MENNLETLTTAAQYSKGTNLNINLWISPMVLDMAATRAKVLALKFSWIPRQSATIEILHLEQLSSANFHQLKERRDLCTIELAIRQLCRSTGVPIPMSEAQRSRRAKLETILSSSHVPTSSTIRDMETL